MFVYICACVVGCTCVLMMAADVFLDYLPFRFETDSMLIQLSVVLYQRKTCGWNVDYAQHKRKAKHVLWSWLTVSSVSRGNGYCFQSLVVLCSRLRALSKPFSVCMDYLTGAFLLDCVVPPWASEQHDFPFPSRDFYSPLDQESKFTFDFHEDCFSLAHAYNTKNSHI